MTDAPPPHSSLRLEHGLRPYPPSITLNMADTPHITLNMTDTPAPPPITLNMADAPHPPCYHLEHG